MLLLAIESSGPVCAAGLFEGTGCVASARTNDGHAETLTNALAELFSKARIRPDGIGAIAVGTGPGSFTGLRIGVMIAKALAWSLRKPLIGVSSLEAAACGSGFRGRVAVALDAKRGLHYAAVYTLTDGAARAEKKPCLVKWEDFRRKLPRATHVLESPETTAEGVARAVQGRLKTRRFDDPYALEPLYLHPRDCHVHIP